MRQVRKDVIDKLSTLLWCAQYDAMLNKASLPCRVKYNTPRAEHYAYYDKRENVLYCNSVYYDGTRCHSEITNVL